MVENRKIDGMILSRSTVDNSAMQRYLKEKQVPFVVVGPADEEGGRWGGPSGWIIRTGREAAS